MLRDTVKAFFGRKEKESGGVRGETWHLFFKKRGPAAFSIRGRTKWRSGELDGWAWRLGWERSSAVVLATLVVVDVDVLSMTDSRRVLSPHNGHCYAYDRSVIIRLVERDCTSFASGVHEDI